MPTTPEIPCSFLNRIYPDLYFLLLSDFNDEKLPFCCLEHFYIFLYFSFLFPSMATLMICLFGISKDEKKLLKWQSSASASASNKY